MRKKKRSRRLICGLLLYMAGVIAIIASFQFFELTINLIIYCLAFAITGISFLYFHLSIPDYDLRIEILSEEDREYLEVILDHSIYSLQLKKLKVTQEKKFLKVSDSHVVIYIPYSKGVKKYLDSIVESK